MQATLAYNRFRYYDPEDGRYISQDPIGLLSGEFGFYNYVEDTNGWIDEFGLKKSYGQKKQKKEAAKKKRSPHPIGSRRKFPSRKKAYEAAKKDGYGEPVLHYNKKIAPHGPHYHPNDGNGDPLNHDHYYFPKGR